MVPQVIVKDPGEIGLGAAVRGSIVVRQVKVRDSQIERPAHDGALGSEGPVVTEVLPKPKRHGGEQEAAPSAAAVRHGTVTIFGWEVASHVALLLSLLVTNLFERAAP